MSFFRTGLEPSNLYNYQFSISDLELKELYPEVPKKETESIRDLLYRKNQPEPEPEPEPEPDINPYDNIYRAPEMEFEQGKKIKISFPIESVEEITKTNVDGVKSMILDPDNIYETTEEEIYNLKDTFLFTTEEMGADDIILNSPVTPETKNKIIKFLDKMNIDPKKITYYLESNLKLKQIIIILIILLLGSGLTSTATGLIIYSLLKNKKSN